MVNGEISKNANHLCKFKELHTLNFKFEETEKECERQLYRQFIHLLLIQHIFFLFHFVYPYVLLIFKTIEI